jgi:hypothetical protein
MGKCPSYVISIKRILVVQMLKKSAILKKNRQGPADPPEANADGPQLRKKKNQSLGTLLFSPP